MNTFSKLFLFFECLIVFAIILRFGIIPEIDHFYHPNCIHTYRYTQELETSKYKQYADKAIGIVNETGIWVWGKNKSEFCYSDISPNIIGLGHGGKEGWLGVDENYEIFGTGSWIILYSTDQSDDSTTNLKDLITSTFMHELGHVLGLPHIDRLNCIMRPETVVGDPQPTSFCKEEDDFMYTQGK